MITLEHVITTMTQSLDTKIARLLLASDETKRPKALVTFQQAKGRNGWSDEALTTLTTWLNKLSTHQLLELTPTLKRAVSSDVDSIATTLPLLRLCLAVSSDRHAAEKLLNLYLSDPRQLGCWATKAFGWAVVNRAESTHGSALDSELLSLTKDQLDTMPDTALQLNTRLRPIRSNWMDDVPY